MWKDCLYDCRHLGYGGPTTVPSWTYSHVATLSHPSIAKFNGLAPSPGSGPSASQTRGRIISEPSLANTAGVLHFLAPPAPKLTPAQQVLLVFAVTQLGSSTVLLPLFPVL